MKKVYGTLSHFLPIYNIVTPNGRMAVVRPDAYLSFKSQVKNSNAALETMSLKLWKIRIMTHCKYQECHIIKAILQTEFI